jgi:predicted glycoside hydrolase/deacetylase ChbG (UPF0249 family)
MTLNAQPVEMLIRADDMGMSHGQNEAFRQLIDSGLADMARHRHEELQALLSDEFKEAVASRGIRLVTYRDLVRERGLQTMTKPSYYP